MDRVIAKWITYAAVALAIAYVWEHSRVFEAEIRAAATDWWK
jgi:hypothetical protein